MIRLLSSSLRRGVSDTWMGSWHNVATLFIALVCLGLADDTGSPLAWIMAILVTATASLVAWHANHQRYRAIHDTPTSNIATAAQGFVELTGRVHAMANRLLESRYARQPCLWYRCMMEEQQSNDKWKIIEDETSDAPFWIEDGSGVCLIEPVKAEIASHRKHVWREGDYRYTEYLFQDGDPVYALGEFVTLDNVTRHPEVRHVMNAILNDWKTNQPSLLAQYDLNRDGELDAQEWERVRQAAVSAMRRTLKLDLSHNDLHCLCKPHDGRPFLLSNHPNAQGGRAYRVWAWLQMGIFLSACGGLAIFVNGLN